MANPAPRDLKYTVTFAANTQGAEQSVARLSAASERLQKQTAAAADAMARLQMSQAGGGMVGNAYVPGRLAPGGGGGASGGGGGDGMSMAAMAAKAAFVIQSAANVMDAFGNLGNSMMGARDKLLGFVGAVPLIGDALESITANVLNMVEKAKTDGWFDKDGAGGVVQDTMGGVRRGRGIMGSMIDTFGDVQAGKYPGLGKLGDYEAERNRLRRMPYESAKAGLRRDRDFRLQDIAAGDERLTDRATRSETAVRQMNAIRYAPDRYTGAMAGLSGMFGGGTPGRFDEDDGYDATIRGARMAQIGVREGRNSAADQAQATVRMRLEQERKTGEAKDRSDRSAAELEKASRDATGMNGFLTAIGAVGDEQALKLKVAEAEKDRVAYLKEASRLEALVQKSKEEQLQLTQAESALRKANVAISQAELQVAQQKRAELKGDLAQFGQMDAGRQEATRQAALRSKDVGYQSLTPEEKALLAGTGLTAKYAAERAEKSAEDSPQVRDILAAVGRQDQKALDAKVSQLQTKVKAELVLDTEQLKEELRKQLTDVFAEAVNEVFTIRIREIEMKMQAAAQSRK